jgi:hypothetical protein
MEEIPSRCVDDGSSEGFKCDKDWTVTVKCNCVGVFTFAKYSNLLMIKY